MAASSRSAMPISSRAAGRRDDARGFSGSRAERDHVGGDPVASAARTGVQREIDQRRGDAEMTSESSRMLREKRSIACAQRPFVDHDLDEVAAHRRRADDAHDVGVVIEQQRV